MGLILFLTGIAVAVFSAWLFYKTGWYSVSLFIPLAATPLIAPGYAGLISLFLIPAAFGTTGGFCFRESKDFGFYITVSSIVFAALFTAEYHTLRVVQGTDIIEKGRNEIVLMMEQGSGDMERVFDEYKTPPENREKLKADFANSIAIIKDSKWLQFARDMVPFSAFIFGILICGLSFIILKKWVIKDAGAKVRGLEFLRINDYFIFALIAGWGGFILLDSSIYPAFSITALNLALAVSALYVAQALGIIKYFMIGRGVPAIILPLLILTLLILGAPVIFFMTILLTGLGSLDLWADFRKLGPDKERNNKE